MHMNKGPKSEAVHERGRWWVKGAKLEFYEQVFPQLGSQSDDVLTGTPRTRIAVHGAYGYLMKLEYLFFWIPGLLVLGMAIPTFAMAFALEDCINCQMLVKATGRQWYWVYNKVSSKSGLNDLYDGFY